MIVREVIRSLGAWNPDTHSAITLPPGAILRSCRILRNPAGAEPYVMEFETSGGRYECPLVTFQPRTRSVDVSA